jgi:hypothetical protein
MAGGAARARVPQDSIGGVGMSVWAKAWAYEQFIGNAGAKSVLVALAEFADEFGECWPGHETLASMTELSVRTIERHIATLVEGRWIAAVGRHGDGREARQTYRFEAPAERLNPRGKQKRSPVKLSGDQGPTLASDRPSRCRVDEAPITADLVSPSSRGLAPPPIGDHPSNCRVVDNDHPTISTRPPDNFDTTTRQFRQRSIEEPSDDPSLNRQSLLAAAVPVAACEAAAPPDEVRVIQAFDLSIAMVWGIERSRPWPHPTDRVIAQRWLEAGATLALCGAVFDAVHQRRKAQGEDPPRSLRYHDSAVGDAIKLGAAPVTGSGPTPQQQAQIQERIRQQVAEFKSEKARA